MKHERRSGFRTLNKRQISTVTLDGHYNRIKLKIFKKKKDQNFSTNPYFGNNMLQIYYNNDKQQQSQHQSAAQYLLFCTQLEYRPTLNFHIHTNLGFELRRLNFEALAPTKQLSDIT